MGMTSLRNIELVPAVAGVTTAGRAVRINIAHTVVGPGLRRRPVILVQLDFGAVALHTTGLAGRTPVTAGIELRLGVHMTPATDFGRNQGRDEYRRMLDIRMSGGMWRVLRHPVAVDAGDAGVRMTTALPVGHLARCGLLVAGDAGSAVLAKSPVDLERLGASHIQGCRLGLQQRAERQYQQGHAPLQQVLPYPSTIMGFEGFFQPDFSRWYPRR